MLLVAVVALAAAGEAPSSARQADSGGGEIVFVSDRANPPGEVEVLAPGHAPRELSAESYTDASPVVAPAGGHIAYWSHRSGSWQMYIARPNGSAARQLALGAVAKFLPGGSPSFSPDGRTLLVPLDQYRRPARLALVDVHTGLVRRIGPRTSGTPEWSPDGRLIAVEIGLDTTRVIVIDTAGRRRFSVGVADNHRWSSRGQLAVASTSVANRVISRIFDRRGIVVARVSGSALAWSRDGRLLVLSRPGAIVLYDATTRQVTTLVRGPHDWSASEAALTPDGRYLAYGAPNDNNTLLVALAGGPPKRFARDATVPVWTRDGRSAFLRVVGADTVVYVGDRFGHHALEVGRSPEDYHGYTSLDWTAGGSRLLYTWSSRRPRDLWSVEPDGSGLRQLVATGQDISFPAWSSDGTRLAYSSSPFLDNLCGYCEPRITLADADAHHRTVVPSETLGAEEAFGGDSSWSPDGHELAVSWSCGCEGLDVVRVDGSNRRTLTPGSVFGTAWSPDGTQIAYISARRSIWVVSPTGAHREELVPASPSHPVYSLAWSPDGLWLAFTTTDGLYLAPSDGSGTVKRIAAAHGAWHPSFSPDGHQLVFAASTPGDRGYTDIYVVGVDGSGLHAIAHSPLDDTDPAWQPAPVPASPPIGAG